MSRQPDSAFQQLVNALRGTGNTDVAEFLDSNSTCPNGHKMVHRTSPIQLSLENLRKKHDTVNILHFRTYTVSEKNQQFSLNNFN